MRLTIDSSKLDEDIDEFIYIYLPKYIYKVYNLCVDRKRFYNIDQLFHINSARVLDVALSNFMVTSAGNKIYNIYIDKNIKINNIPLLLLLNIITYGNMTVKGYRVLVNTLLYVANHIDRIYLEYNNGNSLL